MLLLVLLLIKLLWVAGATISFFCLLKFRFLLWPVRWVVVHLSMACLLLLGSSLPLCRIGWYSRRTARLGAWHRSSEFHQVGIVSSGRRKSCPLIPDPALGTCHCRRRDAWSPQQIHKDLRWCRFLLGFFKEVFRWQNKRFGPQLWFKDQVHPSTFR